MKTRIESLRNGTRIAYCVGKIDLKKDHILLKWGHARKGYYFTDEFVEKYNDFVVEFWNKSDLDNLLYIEENNIPVRLYNDFYGYEFATIHDAINYIINYEY